ncbi:MAG: DUF6152 family protein [Acidobacteriota bacterium]
MKIRLLILGAGFAAATATLLAHHSMTAVYNDATPVTIAGTITKFEWVNPHVWVFVDSTGAGAVTKWEVEFASRTELRRSGWTGESLHVGDVVTIAASRARDNSHKAHGKTITLSGGAKLSEASLPAPRAKQASRPAPRWPNGHVRLGAEPGQAGYWANPSRPALFENTAGNLAMNYEGILANIADADKVAPFQPWAKAIYTYRQRNLLKDDPMAVCLPPGGPRQFQAPYGVQLQEDPDRSRVFVLSRGGNRNWRLIDLDGRALPNGEDVTPTFFGYSAGKWEGDTLVIQTVGLIERFWFSNGGLPHTESARLTERISRPDYDTLRYEVTVDDPGAYTRPWTSSWDLQWIAGDDVDEYFCDDYNRELEHVN